MLKLGVLKQHIQEIYIIVTSLKTLYIFIVIIKVTNLLR